jgi:hypothetical protein
LGAPQAATLQISVCARCWRARTRLAYCCVGEHEGLGRGLVDGVGGVPLPWHLVFHCSGLADSQRGRGGDMLELGDGVKSHAHSWIAIGSWQAQSGAPQTVLFSTINLSHSFLKASKAPTPSALKALACRRSAHFPRALGHPHQHPHLSTVAPTAHHSSHKAVGASPVHELANPRCAAS